MFQTCTLAYNLLVWMMWLITRKGLRQEPNPIRAWLIKALARWTTSGRRWILRLPRDYFFKEQWEHLESSLVALCWG